MDEDEDRRAGTLGGEDVERLGERRAVGDAESCCAAARAPRRSARRRRRMRSAESATRRRGVVLRVDLGLRRELAEESAGWPWPRVYGSAPNSVARAARPRLERIAASQRPRSSPHRGQGWMSAHSSSPTASTRRSTPTSRSSTPRWSGSSSGSGSTAATSRRCRTAGDYYAVTIGRQPMIMVRRGRQRERQRPRALQPLPAPRRAARRQPQGQHRQRLRLLVPRLELPPRRQRPRDPARQGLRGHADDAATTPTAA